MLDENNVLHDGTEITADLSPTSTTRTSGSAVLDLRKSPAKGLYAVVFQAENLDDPADLALISIEQSSDLANWVELARFIDLTGARAPDTQERLVKITARYVRAKIDVTDDDGSGLSLDNCVIALATHGRG
ncbi:hypothetical protein LCGC14_1532470 [marine sediment metagenome]|uniref:Uncharacterized protein n=1 Tax=marine sediment metagenome TaxID=412755 RepID=A0A0F9LBE5_9ZZZZ